MTLKYEIVELYPIYGIPKCKLVMSAHIYLYDENFNMDLRGFTVHHHAFPDQDIKICKVYPPFQLNWDYEENRMVKFPVISFNDNKIFEDIVEKLLIAAKQKFKTFKFPTNFPKNFSAYLKMSKKKIKPPTDPVFELKKKTGFKHKPKTGY